MVGLVNYRTWDIEFVCVCVNDAMSWKVITWI